MKTCENDHVSIAYNAPNGEGCPLCSAWRQINDMRGKIQRLENQDWQKVPLSVRGNSW